MLHFQDRSLESDLVFKCTGLRPNTSMTKSIFGKFLETLLLLNRNNLILTSNITRTTLLKDYCILFDEMDGLAQGLLSNTFKCQWK